MTIIDMDTGKKIRNSIKSESVEEAVEFLTNKGYTSISTVFLDSGEIEVHVKK